MIADILRSSRDDEAARTDELTPRERVRRVLAVAGLVVLIAAVLPFLVFAVPQTIGADHGFVILSGSMEPGISPGDVVIVDASASVGVGDVITFDDGNEVPTTHRVVDVQDGQYVTQGDANENADSALVDPRTVLGRVTLIIPLIGHVILWANSPVGYLSLVLVPIGLLLVSELYAWARADEDATGAVHENGDRPPRSADGVDQAADPDAWADSSAFEQEEDESEGPPTTVVERPSSGGIYAVDLHLTALALAVLFAYAGWTLYGEVSAGNAPGAVTVAVLTGAALGMAGATWITGRTWLRRRRAARTAAAERTKARNGDGADASASAPIAGTDDAAGRESDD